MAKAKKSNAAESETSSSLCRVERPLTLVMQVEQALRQAITDGRFADGKLPPEVELAEQLGVGRETVRLAAEVLQREGLLFKVRRRGTFTKPPRTPGQIKSVESKQLGYLQTDFVDAHGNEEVANRAISGMMLQGALAEAGAAGFSLEVHHTCHLQWRDTVKRLVDNRRLRGLILASYAEDKLLRRLSARDLPVVLLDEDVNVPHISTVRDDCFEGARLAVAHLAELGHRQIAYAHWERDDQNRWRPMGFQRGLQDARLPHRKQNEILTELTIAGAKRLIDQFLHLKQRPTALYCFNNTLANVAITELRSRGVKVPHEVSVMGAGGEEIQGLTCHQVDWYSMGQSVIQIMLRAVANPESRSSEHLLTPHTLQQGQTTAVPPSRGTANFYSLG